MSAVSPAYVRRWPWEMSPVRLLLLLLLTCLAGIASGQSEEYDYPENTPPHDVEAEATAEPFLEEVSEPEVEPGADEEEENEIAEADLPTAESSSGYENESTLIDYDDYGLGNRSDSTSDPLEKEGLSPTIILVPVVLVVVIIGMIVCGIAMSRKWNQKMTASDGMNESYANANSSEKVPMPMFDDDIPSVLELEMEDMDQWIEKQA